MSYVVLDIETTTHTSYKRKANPFDPRNWVVLAGFKRKGGVIEAKRYSGPHDQQHAWLDALLTSDTKFIVGTNIKFDLLHLLKDPQVYRSWRQWVAGGGLVWDTQLAEYLLDGQIQSSHMLSLDELSLRYGGDTKVDEVKVLWESGVPTEDIDPDLLMRYLVGEDLPNGERREGDIGNTELVFLKQLERARNSGQARSIMLNMGSLLATIEMERNGMHVDTGLGHVLAGQLAERLDEAKARLQSYLPPDLPFEFSWTNRYHLSPLIFGGKIKYQRRQYDLKDGRTTWFSPDEKPQARDLFAYAQKDEVQWYIDPLEEGKADQFQLSNIPPEQADNARIYVTYSSGKQKGEYKTKKVKVDDYTKPKSRMADCYWEFPGFTEPAPEWASSTDGLYSVAADVIDELGNRDIPFLKDLSSVTAMDKDLGTYFIRDDPKGDGKVGMLTLVQPDSIIHHSLNHTSTVTGRFSSSNPNLQNIPKGNKSDVKKVFRSRFSGGYILQSDFSSLEVYVQAILTACRQLVADLRAGVDMHCMRLAAKEGMEYDDVVKLCKGWKETATSGEVIHHAAVPEWDYKRTGAKVFSFQRAYGAGNATIARATNMALADVESLAAAEAARYPEIEEYFAKRTDEIARNRRPTSRIVPHPQFPHLMCQLGISRVSTPDGKLYTYVESPSPEYLVKRGTLCSFSPTEIKNYEVQGTGGEWMKAAMWLAVREFYRTYDGSALLVNTVHDAMYVDCEAQARLKAGVLLQACMEAASDFMEWWFNWPLPLPVPTDTVYGSDMGEENKFTDLEFKALVSEARADIRRRYMNGHEPSYMKEST